MIQRFKDFPIRHKLIVSFGLIIAINAVFGVFSLSVMRQLGELVNVTYDKALMSGTFAQAAKFNFAVYDAQTRAALFAAEAEDFSKLIAHSQRAFETLDEDLVVVSERALGLKSQELIDELRPALTELHKTQAKLIQQKTDLLRTQNRSLQLVDEWNTAILKAALDRKLTALYDDAAELGYQFRMTSEEKNQKSLYLSLAILIGCIAVSLLLSFVVAYFLILPLVRLASVCGKVAQGDYSLRATVEAKDEIGELANSFNTMLVTIQKKDENIAALLESLPFGLFYIDELGRISRERSPATERIFKNFGSYENLEAFFRDHAVGTETIGDILRATFQKLLPFKSAVFLFPDHVTVQEGLTARTIQLSYRPQYGPKKKLERLILLAEDVTEKNKAMAESRSLTERVERISKVAADVPGFKGFIVAAGRIFDSADAKLGPAQDSVGLARDLHSLKGLLGMYAFTSCAAAIHDIEANIHSSPVTELRRARETFEHQARDSFEVLTVDVTQDLKYFDSAKIARLKQIVSDEGNQRILRLLGELDRFPLAVVFGKYVNHTQAIAKKFEDKKVGLTFTDSDEISFEEAQRLDAALVHLLNNSIDHGLEPVARRRELGKNETGEICIVCRRRDDQGLELKVSDDGQGINAELLVAKAVASNAMTEQEAAAASHESKLNLIFRAGLSTKDEASQISGRGVGMDAVKSYIESLGGSIQLQTELNRGTTFIIHVPPLEMHPPL